MYHTDERTVLAQDKEHQSFRRKDPFVISNPIFASEKDSQEGTVKVFWHSDWYLLTAAAQPGRCGLLEHKDSAFPPAAASFSYAGALN